MSKPIYLNDRVKVLVLSPKNHLCTIEGRLLDDNPEEDYIVIKTDLGVFPLHLDSRKIERIESLEAWY